MTKVVVSSELLFEIVDVFGKRIRTTNEYFRKIKEDKHSELEFGVEEIKETITKPDEVNRSLKDDTIMINFRLIGQVTLVVVTKHMNGDGFLVTAYQTTKVKRKGEKLWPR